MVVYNQISEIQKFLSGLNRDKQSVGLVPTMGAIHEGHLTLLETARSENEFVISSIFVNPIQFNNPRDYNKYPRNINHDIELLKQAQCDGTFIPTIDEMYPNPSIISFNFGTYDKGLEGAHRPGHFSGVGIVLSKLFNIIKPDRAYFGQKDLQQAVIVTKLSQDLHFGVEIKVVPTKREADGLAFSSRNQRLDTSQRKDASRFYSALKIAQKALNEGQPVNKVIQTVTHYINELENMSLEYFEVVNSETLNPVSKINSKEKIALCIAGFVGEIRLLDNIYLDEN